jgi:hypothetical protein
VAGLRDDVAFLSSFPRDSAGAGERASAEWVAARMREVGAPDAHTEPFRYAGTYAHAYGLHGLALTAAAAVGGWAGRVLALATLASYELEVSGRNQWVRRLLPRGDGANAIGYVPARGAATRTLVVVAHHDAARTGLVWSPALAKPGAARRLRRRASDPVGAPFALGALAAATGTRAGRWVGGAIGAATAGLMADVAASETVPGASDNATGVAAMLALAARLRAEPADGLEVLLVAPGCEESGMGGMAAFLERHGRALDPATTLVLGLDTLGAGTPIVARAEGALLPHAYRDADNDVVDAGARRAGLEPPVRWRIGAYTDPILAVFAGLPAVSMLSIGPDGAYPNYHLSSDTPEHVDWDSVERCLDLAEATAREWALSAR